MKKTCLDAFNPIYFGEAKANQFDKNLFYETLVTNDKIVLANDHFLDCVELSAKSLPRLFRLLEKDEISIFYDFVPLRYIKHSEENVMIELELKESVNLDHFFANERYKNLKRNYRRLIDSKIQILDCKQIDFNGLCQYACSILNDKQLLVDIYRSTKPYHMINDILQHFEYTVTAKDGIFYIETEDIERKGISRILIGEFLTTIVRSYINLLSQREIEADSLILSNSNRTIFERLFTNKVNKSAEYLNELFTIEYMPDLASYFSLKNTNISDVFELRDKSRNLIKFINETEYTLSEEFYKEYRDRVENQYKFLNGKTYKTIRLILTSIISPLGTVLDISDILGLTNFAINKFKPTVRLQDIYK
ncbi:hypothetical protein [Paenibacillus terrae]|uniref:Uncharacterized protein n=1 Tax=Paenibacillus terrae TaxID=159743 RepID=A0A0D7WTG8_9BACL|nr:hypothetical protein [Paenibacillus terrae]KJD42289.1 hypothetical protein QD47_29095 [Paenibacillus terrae]